MSLNKKYQLSIANYQLFCTFALTMENPYVITAVYYYQIGENGLPKEYIDALKAF